jgi:predicted acyl esterase
MRYRHGGTADWLVPGEPAEVTVELQDTAHTFRPGHRIRVQIAGASWPRRSRNLHTTTVPELGTLDEAVVARHTVHHDAARPSRLVGGLTGPFATRRLDRLSDSRG